MKSNHADYRVTRHQSNADQWATGGLTHVVLKKDRVFAKTHFRKKYLQLELRVGRGKISDPDFQYWRQGESSWGYVQVYPSKGIPDKVIAWIEMAKNFVVEGGGGR